MTTLADSSVDVVTAASALHWFEPVSARAELSRILRRRKWVVALWNFRVANATAFSQEFDQVWRDHLGPPPAGNRAMIEDLVVPTFFGNGKPHRRLFENPLACTEEQLLGLAWSSSNAPSENDTRRSDLETAMRALHRRYRDADIVTVSYETVLYCGTIE